MTDSDDDTIPKSLDGRDWNFEATLTVPEFTAIVDARSLFALMVEGAISTAIELTTDHSGVAQATLEYLDNLVERLRPLEAQTEFSRHARELADEIIRKHRDDPEP
jgi:hypothetical protein